MKKRLFTMLIVIVCVFTAALPAYASNDASLSILGNGQSYSTGLVQGYSLGTLYVNSFSISSDEIYYSVTDQNDELVAYGWLQPNSSVAYNGYNNTTDINGRASFFRNSWNMTPTTALNLTMTCSAACDASGYIEVLN